MRKTLVIDFDGTIAEWGEYPNPGPPIPGVRDVLIELQEMGFTLLIASSRTCDEISKHPIDKKVEKDRMEEYLIEHDIPFDEVLKSDKPVAMFYIDDRALEFKGDWKEVLKKVKEEE